MLVTVSLLLLLAQQQGRQRPVDPAKPQNNPQATQQTASPAPGAPFSPNVDETPVVTHHEIRAGGKTLGYTATAAQMPLITAGGETEAHIFFVAYTLDGTTEARNRPLTFAFNGGPGAASIWVHMGTMGPRRVKLLDDGN